MLHPLDDGTAHYVPNPDEELILDDNITEPTLTCGNVVPNLIGDNLIGIADMNLSFEDNSQLLLQQPVGVESMLIPEMLSVKNLDPHYGIYEHEADCIYAKNNESSVQQKKIENVDSGKKMANFHIGSDEEVEDSDDDGDDEEEEEMDELEMISPEPDALGLEENLDLSVSITESSDNPNNKSTSDKMKLLGAKPKLSKLTLVKNHRKKVSSKKDSTTAACIHKNQQPHAHHDHTHHIAHEYMRLRRKHKLLEILLEMKFITDRLRQEDDTKELIAEWRYAATVLDRVCLILFSLFTVLSLAICLYSAPQLIV